MRAAIAGVSRAAALLAVFALAAVAASAQPAHASRFLKIGIYDEAQTLYGPVERTYPR